ncbi:MAG: SBBP repeat-containing protein [Promethearchaeota archaeon]
MKKRSTVYLGLLIVCTMLSFYPALISDINLYDRYQSERRQILSIASLDEEVGYEWNRTWDLMGQGAVGSDIAIDSSDAIYITGRTWDIYVGYQAALIKYDTLGNIIWSRIWDGVNDVRSFGVVIDSSDNVYMGGYGTLGLGAFDLFLVKYNSLGTIQWSRIWGGSNYERIYGITVDSSDNVYLVGETESWGAGNEDMVLIKYDNAGTLQWNRTWGLSGSDIAYTVGTDNSDNVYMVGTTTSFIGSLQWNIVKYNSGGTLLWNRTWGAFGNNYAYGIAFDSSDNVYIAGERTHPTTYYPSVALVKFDSLGVELYNQTWNEIGYWGNREVRARDIVLDSSEDIYLACYTGQDNMMTVNSYLGLLKYNTSGDSQGFVRWDKDYTAAYGIALDSNENVYVGGESDDNMCLVKYNLIPQISINSPNENEIFGSTAPNFDISIIDSDLDSRWYTIDGGITNITFTGLTGTIDQIEWDKLSDVPVTLTFYANDSAGNIGHADVNIYKDATDPQITINAPLNSEIFGSSAPNFDLYIFDLNLNSTWYTIDGGVNNITFTGLTGTIDQAEWDKLSDVPVTLTFYANDSVGNIGHADVNIYKDSSIPQITINTPLTNEFFGSNAPNFDISIVEPNLDYTWYTIDGGVTNITFTGLTGTIDQIEWDKLSDVPVTLTFYANDTIGNIGHKDVVINKDSTNPQIVINVPTHEENFGNIAPNFDISIVEPNLDTTWYTIDGGVTNIIFTGLTGTVDQTEWDKLSDGALTLIFYANDSAGNIGSVGVLIIKDTSMPQITINAPLANEFFGSSAPNFDISIFELNLNSTWYTIDGGITNITFTGLTGTIDQTEWDKIGATGPVIIRFYANDTLGSLAFADVTIYKDVEVPSSQILFIPHSGTVDVNVSTIFTLTASDGTGSGVFVIRYKINDSTWNDYTGEFDLSGYAFGYYNISYYAIDNVGNIENVNSILVELVEIPPPPQPGIPGYDILIIMGIIGVSMIIILRKRKNYI